MDMIEKGPGGAQRPSRSRTNSLVCLGIIGVISIAAMVTTFYMAGSPSLADDFVDLFRLKTHAPQATTTAAAEQVSVDCGSSREEALAKGCIFDIMYNGWLPPLCHDAELHQEAMRNTTQLASLHGSGRFTWWREANHSTGIDQDDLWTIEESHAFTYESYHVAHCLYDWRLTIKSINRMLQGEEVWVPERIINVAHIGHCNMVVATQVLNPGGKVLVKFGYGKCVRLESPFLS